jgi:hypothetical protein
MRVFPELLVICVPSLVEIATNDPEFWIIFTITIPIDFLGVSYPTVLFYGF